jgi:hypothetical protein
VKRVLAMLAVAACGEQEFVIAPQIVGPVGQDPFEGLSSIKLVVKHSNGSVIDDDFFERGQTIQLANIPFSDDIVIELQGFRGSDSVAPFGGRTCPFAVRQNEDPPAPHLYFSARGTVGTIELSTDIRSNGAALANPDNTIVLLGGEGVQSLESFDPLSGEKLPDTGLRLESRTKAAIALLSKGGDPRPVIMGGLLGGAPATTIEIIDLEAGLITTQGDDMHALERTGAIATELTDGRILVTGGRDNAGVPTGTVGIVDFSLSTNQTVIEKKGASTIPRADHAAVRMGDNDGAPVLIVGGAQLVGNPPVLTLVPEAELFKPLNDDIPLGFRPQLNFPRRNHRAVVIGDNSAVIIGGIDASGNPVRRLERFSFIDNAFTDAGELPEAAGAVDFSVTPLPDGRVLLAGGRNDPAGPALDGLFLLEFKSDSDTISIGDTGQHLATPRANQQAVLLCDGTVLITGGTEGPSPAERFNAIVFAQ